MLPAIFEYTLKTPFTERLEASARDVTDLPTEIWLFTERYTPTSSMTPRNVSSLACRHELKKINKNKK